MDLIDGPNLRKYVKDETKEQPEGSGLTEAIARDLFKQLLDALSYLHSPTISICHR